MDMPQLLAASRSPGDFRGFSSERLPEQTGCSVFLWANNFLWFQTSLQPLGMKVSGPGGLGQNFQLLPHSFLSLIYGGRLLLCPEVLDPEPSSRQDLEGTLGKATSASREPRRIWLASLGRFGFLFGYPIGRMFTTLLIAGLKRFTQLEFVSLRGGFFPSKEEVYSFL